MMTLDQWPPPQHGKQLLFWTWQQYWGNQAQSFKYVRDLESVDRETLASKTQYQRLRDGDSPDVVHITSRHFERAVDEGMLQPLPVEQLPSWPPETEHHAHNLDFYQRDDLYYGIPHEPLAYSLAFNQMGLERPESWGLLWDSSLAEKIAMPADPTLLCQTAALYTGQDPREPDDYGAIEAALSQQQPLVAGYWSDWMNCWDAFEYSGVQAAVLPNPKLCLCSQDKTPIGMANPNEGVVYAQNTFAIPAGASNPFVGLEFAEWGRQFKGGSDLGWNPTDSTLYEDRALDAGVREKYQSIAASVGTTPELKDVN